MAQNRLDKVLSHEGFGTRRDVKRLLHTSEVLVNGVRVTDPGFHCDVDKDQISIDGELLSIEKNIYLMMNKPKDVVCANKDGLHATVFSLLEEKYQTGFALENLHLIGRLDIDTEGLLIFTTDGKLTHRLISPKSNCPKTYFVRLEKALDENLKKDYEKKLCEGFYIPAEGNETEFTCLPSEIEFTQNDDEVYLTIVEGKFHQVKRMFAALGNVVVYLKRVSMGGLELDQSLECGQYRKLTAEEIKVLSSCL
ncbi:pseudouridine synthase [Treponema sp.]|uniref:pseudouridine synthase n=1 Tax=Treponema sp. TaxID=166 RepID=UPI00298D8D24|nr:pseudouridine synthase [Treponema sp.]MCR5614527.1 rRNA pseudouridine synthase [Treponema sp.]